MPSRTLWGSPSRIARSIKAPGSPSSALQMIYFSSPLASLVSSHFRPVGKPAPPRPRRPDVLITEITFSGGICSEAFFIAWYPCRERYSPIASGSICPQLRKAIRVCRVRKSESVVGVPSGPRTTHSATGFPFSRCSSMMRETISVVTSP